MVSRVLGGSCEVPLAAYATWHDGALHLRGIVATPDGQRVLSAQASAPAPTTERAIALGREVASALEQQGAMDIVRALSTASAVDGAAASSGNGAADSAVSGD
jgi:hydroxymethylbilane synthase